MKSHIATELAKKEPEIWNLFQANILKHPFVYTKTFLNS